MTTHRKPIKKTPAERRKINAKRDYKKEAVKAKEKLEYRKRLGQERTKRNVGKDKELHHGKNGKLVAMKISSHKKTKSFGKKK